MSDLPSSAGGSSASRRIDRNKSPASRFTPAPRLTRLALRRDVVHMTSDNHQGIVIDGYIHDPAFLAQQERGMALMAEWRTGPTGDEILEGLEWDGILRVQR